MARHREFDVAEMSFRRTACRSTNQIGRSSRCRSIHRASSVTPASTSTRLAGIREPKDLIGKRIASPEYQMTAPVWIRGILQDHYGVPVTNADSEPYRFGGEEEPGRIEAQARLAADIKLQAIGPTQTLSQMLADGDIDALYTARAPSSFTRGDGRVRGCSRTMPRLSALTGAIPASSRSCTSS